MLAATLVVWGGEFGRTPMNEARGGSTFLGRDHHPHSFSIWLAGGGGPRGRRVRGGGGGSPFVARDHHPHSFSIWLAGGGIRGGTSYGETDELGYAVAKDKVG